jgi:hypothetical protein
VAFDSLSKPFDDVDFGSDAKELGDEGTLVATVGARRRTRDRGSDGTGEVTRAATRGRLR